MVILVGVVEIVQEVRHSQREHSFLLSCWSCPVNLLMASRCRFTVRCRSAPLSQQLLTGSAIRGIGVSRTYTVLSGMNPYTVLRPFLRINTVVSRNVQRPNAVTAHLGQGRPELGLDAKQYLDRPDPGRFGAA